jgi:hypothetical protein
VVVISTAIVEAVIARTIFYHYSVVIYDVFKILLPMELFGSILDDYVIPPMQDVHPLYDDSIPLFGQLLPHLSPPHSTSGVSLGVYASHLLSILFFFLLLFQFNIDNM